MNSTKRLRRGDGTRLAKIATVSSSALASGENFVAFTATQDDKPSYEDARIGHGFFTEAVVEGFRGAAEDKDHAIKVFNFRVYLDEAVPRIARVWGYVQKPKFSLGPENFTLVRK